MLSQGANNDIEGRLEPTKTVVIAIAMLQLNRVVEVGERWRDQTLE
jgi:hypothetical protein